METYTNINLRTLLDSDNLKTFTNKFMKIHKSCKTLGEVVDKYFA